jgi:hypothetical protein
MGFGRRGCAAFDVDVGGGLVCRWSVRSEGAGRLLHGHRRRRGGLVRPGGVAQPQWGRMRGRQTREGGLAGRRASVELAGGALAGVGAVAQGSSAGRRQGGGTAARSGDATIPRSGRQDGPRKASPAPGQRYANGGRRCGRRRRRGGRGFVVAGNPKFKWGFFVRVRAPAAVSLDDSPQRREVEEGRGEAGQGFGNRVCKIIPCRGPNY